ncbi:uncharacterized protein LTR77_004217 [Saxophila tyrrhenica]|uniref:Uncharacterized protein n=1 Tax=Saxophila tyrrhenica TaxID=1690608 RepID=A0AAV9PGC4_9PEZI|nr:hypothetical protein LTR77_004217 [Saxophila tyrrhenica]
MSAVAQAGPVPAATPPASMSPNNKANGVMKIHDIIHADPRRLLVLFDKGQDEIVRVVADVLGQPFSVVASVQDAGERTDVVVGIENGLVYEPEVLGKLGRIVITTHGIDVKDCRDEYVTSFCDYEYLYSSSGFKRGTISRYLGFILGELKPHEGLKKKSRTTLLSTTFPDIRAALSNMDILSVGADSVELRVDLLQEPGFNGASKGVPSLKYVGEQVMMLRERTELPIIFTTRCTAENGRFPMDNPALFYEYLHKAIQWGCAYIDVELWLPEDIRRRLSANKGSTRIISAWHDFSGRFRWSSAEARQVFEAGAVYGDVVKMIAIVNSADANYELEYFRSAVQGVHPQTPFSAVNMGPVGQLSRTLNQVFTPITHPLLPAVAAPGQLSAAEIGSMLHSMGHVEKQSMYAIGNVRANGQAMFLEKVLNELSLPHRAVCIDHLPQNSLESILSQPDFGGAWLNPPLSLTKAAYLPRTTEAAAAIGQVDTVVVRSDTFGKTMVCDNATWKGIRATLTRDHVPSAYADRPALVLANTEAQAAAAIYALRDLKVSAIYTIGFTANASNGPHVQQFRGVADMKQVPEPFVIVSALPADKSLVVLPLLRHYSGGLRKTQRPGKVFLDLANGQRVKKDSVAAAAELGWRSYRIGPVNTYTMVAMLRLLLGVNLGYDFVRLANGRYLYE